MSIRFVGYALHAPIYKGHANAKLLLVALCNYSDDRGVCYGSNEGLAEIVGCDRRHILRLKAKLSDDKFIKIHEGGGRGRATWFTINVKKLRELSERKEGHEVPEWEDVKGDMRNTKGGHDVRKQGHEYHPKGKKGYKRARARSAHDIDDDRIRASRKASRHDVGDGADTIRQAFQNEFGDDKYRAWLEPASLDASNPARVEISVRGAFEKGRLENEFETWLQRNNCVVVTAKQDVRAA